MFLSPTVYLWVKALHIVAVITWMAALLYLPRLFVYHAQAKPGSETSETLKIMERRLLRGIMTPSMIAVLILGGILIANLGAAAATSGWLLVKLVCVIGIFAVHMACASWTRAFAEDRNTRPHTFYRWVNEAPAVLMVVIVVMAVLKPF